MAATTFTGSAAPVAQISTVTIALTWATSDTLVFAIGDKKLTITVGATATTAAVATALKEAINGDTSTGDESRDTDGSEWGELLEMDVTATVNGSVVTLTAGTAGIPFTFSTTATTAGSGTSTDATTQAATGPEFFDNADNWDTGSVPGAADEVLIADTSKSIRYGLGSGDGTGLVIKSSFTGHVGLPIWNTNTNFPFREYRATELDFSAAASTVDIGEGLGDGSGLIKIDVDGGGGNYRVHSTGTRAITGEPAVRFSGAGGGEDFEIYSGDVWISSFAGGSQTVGVGYVGTQATDANVVLGSLFDNLDTLATLRVSGGTVKAYMNITTVNAYGGEFNNYQAGTLGTVNLYGNAVHYDRSDGTTTTVNIYGDEVVHSYDRDTRAKTVTTINKYTDGSTVSDVNKRVTSLKVVGSTKNINWGNNSTLTRS